MNILINQRIYTPAVHRRGSDSNHGLGLDTLFIDTHEQNFIRRLLPLELELLLSCTTTKTPNT